MDPIEKAIRNALEKGNPVDASFRQRVYASAEAALGRSLSAQPNVSEAQKAQRIANLRTIERSIESEFQPAVEPVRAPAPQLQKRDDWSVAPPVRNVAPAEPRTPVVAAPTLKQVKKIVETKPKKRSGSGGVLRGLLNLIIFLALIALALFLAWKYWAAALVPKEFGGTAEKSDLSTSQSSGASSAKKLGKATATDDSWISVFAPSDAASVDVSDGLTAELQGAGADQRLRLVPTTKNGAKTGATFEVGRGILEKLRGKKVVFDIFAKADEGAAAEMSVSCDLAGMGTCQRTRFHLESQPGDNLLVMQLADNGPEASGTLTISPDIEGASHPVEIYSIRVQVAP